MGTLSQKLQQLGLQNDVIGRASEPNVIIPESPVSRIVTNSLYCVEKPPDNSPAASMKAVDELDETVNRNFINKDYNSVHPSNSVWISHAI